MHYSQIWAEITAIAEKTPATGESHDRLVRRMREFVLAVSLAPDVSDEDRSKAKRIAATFPNLATPASVGGYLDVAEHFLGEQ